MHVAVDMLYAVSLRMHRYIAHMAMWAWLLDHSMQHHGSKAEQELQQARRMQCHSNHHHFIKADTCRMPQGMLNTLKSKQQHLVEQHEKSKTLTRSSEVREIKDDIQKEVDEVLQLMQLVKVRLDALDKTAMRMP